MIDMYNNQDMTTPAIAKYFGVAINTVNYHLKKNGVKLNRHLGRHSYCDVTGQTINNLYFIRNTKDKKGSNYVWEIKCYCGTIFFTTSNNVKLGVTKSCGCYQKQNASKRMSQLIGPKNLNWNPDRDEVDRIRSRTKSDKWREQIYERDNYTCQCCNKKSIGNIVAHHLDGYHWCEEGRYDVDNGITLCVNCHKVFHKIYGVKNNTKQQFEEFMKEKE